MTRSALALFFSALALPAMAQTIYKCTDASGGTLISTTRLDKNCKAVVNSETTTVPAPKAGAKSGGAASNPTPGSFPKVQEDTQKARDGDRRHILEQELAAEQRNLERSRKDLGEQERAVGDKPDRLLPYKDSVAQHERNIQAIQKELSNLK
ncbi:MAG: DUF4124 domain-containing protein [Azonexus sp.]